MYLQLQDFWTVQVFPRDHHWKENRIVERSASLSPNTDQVTSGSLPVSNSCHSVYQEDLAVCNEMNKNYHLKICRQ